MIPVVFAGGILIALLAALSRRASAAPAAAPAAAAAAVQKIVATGDPKKIVAAAVAAKQAGEHQLAEQLVGHARNAAVTGAKVYPSPWANVDPAGWTKYVIAMRGKDPRAVTPGYSLGLFGFGMRRLVDLGLAANPHQGDHSGKKVWLADWSADWQPGPDKFLADADGQYKTFIKSSQQYATRIRKELPEMIGATLEGQPVSMSGLLALAHRAGWEGMKKWLSDPKVRAEHKQSTELFHRLNGAF